MPGLIQGEATGARQWQGWLAGLRCHELSVQDWLPAQGRLVIVAPHPDDEILASGGLISMHVARGGKVFVVAVTDGEASHGATSGAHRQALAVQRRNERLVGLQALGVAPSSVLSLGLGDGQVQQQVSVLLDRLMRQLQPDDLVVSTWEHDGHPDHDTTGQAARAACAAIGCAYLAAPVWMWHWAKPGDARVPWLRLRALPLAAADARHKQTALQAHASQLSSRSDSLGAVLGPAIVERASWRTEYYFV